MPAPLHNRGMDMSGHLYLAALWALWCGAHSLLLWRPLRIRLQAALGMGSNAYRAWYSLAALLSLAPVLWASHRLGGAGLGLWPGGWAWLQAGLWAVGLGLMLWGWLSFRAQGMDLLGWEQAAHGTEEPPQLVSGGAYAYMRHPLYVGALVLIWARPLDVADFVVNLVLSAYLYLGSLHEEERMIASFGEDYRRYRRRVPWLPLALPRGRGGGKKGLGR